MLVPQGIAHCVHLFDLLVINIVSLRRKSCTSIRVSQIVIPHTRARREGGVCLRYIHAGLAILEHPLLTIYLSVWTPCLDLCGINSVSKADNVFVLCFIPTAVAIWDQRRCVCVCVFTLMIVLTHQWQVSHAHHPLPVYVRPSEDNKLIASTKYTLCSL